LLHLFELDGTNSENPKLESSSTLHLCWTSLVGIPLRRLKQSPMFGTGSPFSHYLFNTVTILDISLSRSFSARKMFSVNNESVSLNLRRICSGECRVRFISITPTPFFRGCLSVGRWTYFRKQEHISFLRDPSLDV